MYILSSVYFPDDYWPADYWPNLPAGANIQYTEVYALTVELITSADFAVTMPQVITMATYAELST